MNKRKQIEFDKKAKALRKSQEGRDNKDVVQEIVEESLKKINATILDESTPVNEVFGISGIYYLFNEGKIVYIGESTCVMSRISQHYKEGVKTFTDFKYYVFNGSDKERKKCEEGAIKKHNPILNFQHNTDLV